MRELQDRLQRALGDRYRIERELGSGGMGVVFLAADIKLGRPVAIKVLRPEIAQAVGNERFLREIRISAQLSHPHILSLIDSGVAADLLYYVMFYVRGETLRDRLTREGQLPVDESTRIALQVADALDYAHRRGVIHRDIKPENILLEEGHALVCDFGIARAIGAAGGEKLTRTGFVVGTPAYMSPEQGTGEIAVDHRADIYALGCVLYETFIGTPPFGGITPQVILARKCVEPAPGLRGVRDTIPVHVEQAVLKALCRTPADRFQSAGAFAEALADPKQAERATRRDRRKVRARRATVAVAGAIGVAAIVVGATLLVPRGGGPIRVRSTQLTALPGLEDRPSFSPDGQWFVYAGDNGADRDIYLRSLTGERAIDLTDATPGDDHSPAFSPDGQQIAFRSTRAGGGLFVMGRTGEAIRRVSDRGEDPAWSPDGGSLVYSHEHVGVLPLNGEPGLQDPGLSIVDLETLQTRELVRGNAVLPSWSPDGRWIAYTNLAGTGTLRIWLVRAIGGTPTLLSDGAGNDWGSAWSPDGRFVYFSSDRGGSMNLWRVAVDPASGQTRGPPEPLPTPSAFAGQPSVSGDGAHVLYTSVLTTQNIERARLDPRADTLLEPFLLTTGTREWSSPDPSPDGSRIAFYTRNLPEGDLYVVRRDGTGLRQLTGDSAIDRVPRWSPDGTRIAYFSTRSGAMDTWVIDADGSHNQQLTSSSTVSAPGAWSPDGRRLAIYGISPEEGYILDLTRTWDEQTPQPLVPDTAWGRFVVNDWSPDGTRLAGMRSFSDKGVGYYELATGRRVRLTDFGQWPVWMPDSRHMLFVSGGKAFYLVDSQSGAVQRVYSTFRDILGPPRVTADGREVVYSRRHTEGDIWLVTIEAKTR
jgi:eukaryotic-like serine/threonine-protein kinase